MNRFTGLDQQHMLDSFRVKLNRMPVALVFGAAVAVLAASAGAIYVSLRAERPPVGSRYLDTIYRKCSDLACGHVVADSRYDLLRKGYMPFERVEEPLGEGRKCPKCGKMTLGFASKDPHGNIVLVPVNTPGRDE